MIVVAAAFFHDGHWHGVQVNATHSSCLLVLLSEKLWFYGRSCLFCDKTDLTFFFFSTRPSHFCYFQMRIRLVFVESSVNQTVHKRVTRICESHEWPLFHYRKILVGYYTIDETVASNATSGVADLRRQGRVPLRTVVQKRLVRPMVPHQSKRKEQRHDIDALFTSFPNPNIISWSWSFHIETLLEDWNSWFHLQLRLQLQPHILQWYLYLVFACEEAEFKTERYFHVYTFRVWCVLCIF